MRLTSKAILLIASMVVCLNIQAQVITEGEALEIADRFFSKAGTNTRSAIPQLTKAWDSNTIGTQTRSTSAPTYHVFTPESGTGFVIVSGEQCQTPIIGYSLESSIASTEDLPLGMIDYLNEIDNEISMARANRTNNTQTRAAAPETEIGNVVKLIETANWGQRHPYNQLTTNDSNVICATGCIPTAFAIVMRHHEWPASPAKKIYNMYTYPDIIAEKDYTYNWSNMPLNNPNDEQGKEISALMLQLGHVFMVSYGTGSTGVEELKGKLNSFWGYIENHAQRMDISDEDWTTRLKEELDANRPMVYCASNNSTGDSRHAFVLDGYTDKDYFHFNWGWNGSCNGYFLLSSMVADTGNDYTQNENTKKAHFVYFLAPDKAYSVSVETSEVIAGSVTIDGEDIATKEVQPGTVVTLSATANSGYEFLGWDDSNGNRVSSENSLTVTINSDVTYKAVFATESTKCNVTVSSMTTPSTAYGGTATASAETVSSGSSVTLTATPATNYKFIGWSNDGINFISTENPYTATITGNIEFVAHFEEKTKYTVTATSADTSMGSATVNGSASSSIYEGTPVTLVATPVAGYEFVSWSIGTEVISNNATYVTTPTTDSDYIANFKKSEEKITIKFNRLGGFLYVGESGTYFVSSLTVEPGTKVTIRAVPESDDKEFYYWYNEKDEILSNKATYTFTVTKAQTYKTKFGVVGGNSKVTLSVQAEEGGNVQIGNTAALSAELHKGEEVTLKATPADGSTFIGWYIGNEVKSTSTTYTIVVQDAAEYIAKFEASTGINTIPDNSKEQSVIYDLMGRSISEITKPGIYIINGKKVLVK